MRNLVTDKEKKEGDVDTYGDPFIRSADAPVPRFLTWTYTLLPIWGIITLIFFWNGSTGWTDRGYWQQLQRAANTTVPEINYETVKEVKSNSKDS